MQMDPGILNSPPMPAPSLLQTSNCAPTCWHVHESQASLQCPHVHRVQERVGQCPFHRPGSAIEVEFAV